MRVAPVALLYRQRPLEEALAASDRVTEITHDHPEGIKGARAVTEAIWLALRGERPDAVRREITRRYDYDLEPSVEAIRPSHRFDVTCQGTVPTALTCALESTSLEDAVRNAVSLGGDADTLAAIAGAVGEALHGLPEELVQIARERYLGDAEDITATFDVLYERAAHDGTPESREAISEGMRNRAQGCLLGQLAGDSLGSLVEFEDASTIQRLYPNGVRELADGGVWDTLAGQPTRRLRDGTGPRPKPREDRSILDRTTSARATCAGTGPVPSTLGGRPHADSRASRFSTARQMAP